MWNSSQSFTLLEVLIAIFLITVGVAGAFNLIQGTIALSSIFSSQLEAAYLAQGGIEIVRNIRDSNWLARNPWDLGLTGCEGGCVFGTVPSKFTRTITIAKTLPDKMVVSARVAWQERGRAHSVTAQTDLYNWR